jgi:hypothetical protein
MKITDLKTAASGGSSGYEFAPGDVKITTKNFETGFYNLNYANYLVRKTDTNINQNLSGPSLDLFEISNNEMTNGTGIGDYSEIYKINATDYISIIIDFYQPGLKDDTNVIIKYISDGNTTDTKTMNFAFATGSDSYKFRSVCNYNDVLYFFKDYEESQNKDYSTAIYKIEIDSVNKTLSTISTISTVNRRILKAFYDKTTSRYITIENNIESNPLITASEYAKCGIFKNADFESINVLSNSTAFFSIDDAEFYDGFFKTTMPPLSTLSNINDASRFFSIAFYSNEDNKIFVYNKTENNYTLVKDKGEVTESIVYNVIDLLDISEVSISQNPLSFHQFGNDYIVYYATSNPASEPCKSFSVYNKLDESSKRIHIENIDNFNKYGFLFVKNVVDYVTWEPSTAVLTHYTDVDSVVKRKVTTFNNTVHLNINDKTMNSFPQVYLSPERIGYNQYVNNESNLYIVDDMGAIVEKTYKLARIDYDQYNFPYVYVAQVTNAPTGLFYLLKE